MRWFSLLRLGEFWEQYLQLYTNIQLKFLFSTCSQVTSVRADFAAQGASVTLKTILHNVFIQLLLGSSPANINFKVLEYLVFLNQPRNSFLCTLWWFSIHKGKEALVIFPHTRITWLFSFVFVSNSSRQYLHEYLNEPGKWRLSTCFRKLFLWFPVLPHSVHLWSLRPSSVGTWSMYSYSCLSSCPPASTKWTTTSKEVRQSTKKS